MRIELLRPVSTSSGSLSPSQALGQGKSFGEVLLEKLAEVEEMQKEADRLIEKYFAGEVEDVHAVILAVEQANLALQLVVQLRNKVIEAYQEISRMQI